MAWSDSIFTENDRSKLYYLTQALRAATDGGLTALAGFVGNGSARRVGDVPAAGAFDFLIDGERVLLLPGTTQYAEYAEQTAGYVVPEAVGGGLINSYYWHLSGIAFINSANDTSLIFGHSLGGALGCCVGRRFKSAGLSTRVVAIGSPRFCSLSSRGDGGWPGVVHYQHQNDPIGWSPPSGPGGINDWRIPGLAYWCNRNPFELQDSFASPVGILSSVAFTNGSTYHSLSSYAGLFSTPQIFVSSGGLPSMYNIYQATVVGRMHEKPIHNPFWYLFIPDFAPAPVQDATSLAHDLRAIWRSRVLPHLSANYSVLRYEAKRLDSVALVNPAQLDQGSNWRWSEVAVVEGGGLDVGTVTSGTNFPTFVAVGYKKQCGPWRQAPAESPDNIGAVIPGQKIPRGGCGISGIAEITTDNLGDNRIATSSITTWTNVGRGLRIIPPQNDPTATKWQMILMRKNLDGLAISAEDVPPFTGSFNYAEVTALSLNPFLTSRNSRKQRAS